VAPAVGDGLRCGSQPLRNFPPANLAGEDGRGRLGDLGGVPGVEDGHAVFPRLLRELVHRIEPHGDEECVAGEGSLAAGDGTEFLVHLRDGDAFHLIVAVGAEDGVRSVDRHAQARQLVLVNLVPAARRQRFHQPDHLNPGLQRVIPGDQTHVAAAHDEQSLRRPHPVAVHQRLERPRAVDPRQRIPAKHQRLLARPGGDEEDLRLDEAIRFEGF